MKIAIVNHNPVLGINNSISNKVYDCFCGRYVPYKVRDVKGIEDSKHVGVFFLDEKNPELVNKILNLIKNECRKDLG